MLLTNGTTVIVPISEQFSELLVEVIDAPLLDLAKQYDLPITKQQELLLREGDEYLEQFDKVELSEEEQDELLNERWSPLFSSNIKAVKQEGNDLYIMFHDGSVYYYPNKSSMYIPFNEALSAGRLLHRTIRFAKGYKKISG